MVCNFVDWRVITQICKNFIMGLLYDITNLFFYKYELFTWKDFGFFYFSIGRVQKVKTK
jgi:hypothetical protein